MRALTNRFIPKHKFKVVKKSDVRKYGHCNYSKVLSRVMVTDYGFVHPRMMQSPTMEERFNHH